jgi:hypothetical protein
MNIIWWAFKISSQKKIDEFIKGHKEMLCTMARCNCKNELDCMRYRKLYRELVKNLKDKVRISKR